MELSRFNIVNKLKLGQEQHLLYNTFTGGQVVVSTRLLNSLQIMTRSKNAFECRSDQARQLKQLGILVDDLESENARYREWLRINQLGFDELKLTICLTYACNLGCHYCVQGNLPKMSDSITHKTAKNTLCWLAQMVDLVQPKRITVCFFGGEPLLNYPILLELMQGCRDIADSLKLDICFTLVTNGTLLSGKRVEDLKKGGISRIMISLDGPKDIHDSRRAYRKSGRGTFTKIISNIRTALLHLPVIVNIKVDKENQPFFPQLIDDLIELKSSYPLSLAYGFIKRTIGQVPSCAYHVLPDEGAGDTLVQFYKCLLRKGIKTENAFLPSLCSLKRASAIIVDPAGELYKCISGIGTKEFLVGSVEENPSEVLKNIRGFVSRTSLGDERCWSCTYQPLCNGGCRYESLVKEKTIAYKTCRKGFFDRGLRLILEEDALRQVAGTK